MSVHWIPAKSLGMTEGKKMKRVSPKINSAPDLKDQGRFYGDFAIIRNEQRGGKRKYYGASVPILTPLRNVFGHSECANTLGPSATV